jgi:hypothetical protein
MVKTRIEEPPQMGLRASYEYKYGVGWSGWEILRKAVLRQIGEGVGLMTWDF